MGSPDEPESDDPPSLEIAAPKKRDAPPSRWKLEAANKKVLRAWQQIVRDTPANAIHCFDWLSSRPTERLPKRCFPLKYAHQGHWCYEVGAGDRIYYQPDEAKRIVTIWYAGPHPKSGIPAPPRDR